MNIVANLVSKQACPMTASVNWEPQEDTDQIREQWYETYFTLPLSIRLGLCDPKVEEAVLLLSKSYRISDAQRIGEIARLVREVFLKGIREPVILQRTVQKLGLAGHNAEHFMVDLRRVIAFVKKVGQEKFDQEVELIDILSAIKKYPTLGNQKVTEKPLLVKATDFPVEPVVKNWLEDYFSRLGTEKHSSMQRSDYLFNSENGKRLSQIDREKVALILKSYDNNEQIAIEKETQEILFTESTGESNEKKGVALPIDTPPPSVSTNRPSPEQRVASMPAPIQTIAAALATKPDVVNLRQSAENIRTEESRANTAVEEKKKVQFPGLKAESVVAPLPQYQPRPAVVKLEEKKKTNPDLSKNVVDLSEYM